MNVFVGCAEERTRYVASREALRRSLRIVPSLAWQVMVGGKMRRVYRLPLEAPFIEAG